MPLISRVDKIPFMDSGIDHLLCCSIFPQFAALIRRLEALPRAHAVVVGSTFPDVTSFRAPILGPHVVNRSKSR